MIRAHLSAERRGLNSRCSCIHPAVKQAGAKADQNKANAQRPDGRGKDAPIDVHLILIRMAGGIYKCIIIAIHSIVDTIAYART